jgi:DNA-binding winged helix-turn-helix (wHTH) protein/TolB-like protein
MSTPANDPPSGYRFADLTLDVARRSVARHGEPIELKALDFDLLRFLVESAPNVVNADVLAEKVWGRHFVSPENVAQRVMLLRQSLGDDAAKPRYIETVRNKGYRLIAGVERAPAERSGVAPPPRRLRVALAVLAVVAVGLSTGALYRLAGSPQREPPLPRSVAVLPFENLIPDPEYAFFAGSMQDVLVSELTKIGGLRVVPLRPAADSRPPDPRELNVETVLGGSVYYSEGRVLVTPNLTQAASGVSLWSGSYDRELGNPFAIQSEIALDVAYALRIELSDSDRRSIERVPTVDPRAHDFFLRGRARRWRDTLDESLLGIAEIEQALAIDPKFAEAWAADAEMRLAAAYYEPQKSAAHQARGELAAREALKLDAELGEAHAALGYALSMRRDLKGAEAAYRQARTLNVPLGDMPAYSILQLSVGNFASARDILGETRSSTPENPVSHRFLMFAYAALGDWETSTELYESGMRLFARWREAPEQRMHWLIGRRDFAAARAIPIDDPFNAAMLANLDTPAQALAELRAAYAAAGPDNPSRLVDIGLWAGHLGDPVLALEAMRRAIETQGGQMAYLWLPQLASMRRLPEFKAYARAIGLVAYWAEYGWSSTCRPLSAGDFECN